MIKSNLWFVTVLAVLVSAAGCSKGGNYKIIRSDSIANMRLISVQVAATETDETLKAWGKEISDKEGKGQNASIMFYDEKNNMCGTYGGGMFVRLNLPADGSIPGSPKK